MNVFPAEMRLQDVVVPKLGTPGDWLTADERKALTTKSLRRGLTILGIHYALYLATLVGAVAALPLWLNLLFAVANGALIGLIFLIGHDTGHASFVPGRRWNIWLTRIAFTPCLHSRSLWDVVHNRIHHGYANLKGFDYVWAPMSKAEFDNASWARRTLERIYRGPFGPVIYYWYEFWMKKLVLPISPESRGEWRKHLPDTLYVLVVGGGMVALIGVVGHLLAPERSLALTMLIGWVIPFAVWNYLMALSIFLQHNHPMVPWFAEREEWTFYGGNIRGAAHVDLPFDFLPLFKWVMLHNAHHALPSVPIYKLTEAQTKLIEAYGADIVRYKFTLPAYRNVYRACKLFDYERKQWTDFEGRPTAEPIDMTPAIERADLGSVNAPASPTRRGGRGFPLRPGQVRPAAEEAARKTTASSND
ncbi:MAG: fatty acid desaturase [Parvibaculum sp.]|uniref:fatty acid desaturase n=1 Tax=Parvibaculum sp. TaxID=2024848 RepID=UPI003C757ECB